jgi:acetyl/propionyl-CoA carboxylase alpha subunit
MNTRLQVEHPVTEMVAREDLVHWQIRIARGERVTIDPDRALTPHGHAIECRIYAEDPDQGFMPSPGLVRAIRPSAGPGVRDDGGVLTGYTVPVFYDSMIAKLIAWGASRADAVPRMLRALQEYEVLGVRTTIPFFLWLLREPDFLSGNVDTTYLDRLLASRHGARSNSVSEFSGDDELAIVIAAALDAVFRSSAGGNGASRHARTAWTIAGRQEALR